MVAARLRTARNDLFAAGGGPFRRRSHPHFVRGGLPAARRGAPGAHLHPLRRPQGLRLARRNVRHGQRRQMPASQSRGCRQRSADGRPLGFRNRPPRYGRHSRKCRTSLHQSELQGDATQLQPPRTTDRTPCRSATCASTSCATNRAKRSTTCFRTSTSRPAGYWASTRRAMPERRPARWE